MIWRFLSLQVMILSHDRERGRVSLSTKKLEPTPGDMIRNPTLVFEKVCFSVAWLWFVDCPFIVGSDSYVCMDSRKESSTSVPFWQAEEMAQTFRQRIAQAEAMARADMLRFQPEVSFELILLRSIHLNILIVAQLT